MQSKAEIPPGTLEMLVLKTLATQEEALAELGRVFTMIASEYDERGLPLPEDTTSIVNA